MNEIVNLIKSHMSIRKYSDREIDRDKVNEMISCAQMASTSSHFQAYTMIEVQNKQGRDVLYKASGQQKWVLSAPLVVLFCGDLYRSSKYFEQIDKDVLSNTESYTIATIDAALAAQNFLLSAESMGLGGLIVGGIRNDVETISKEFKLTEMVFPLFAICIGYADDVPGLKPRLPQEVVYKFDFYDESNNDKLIDEYNETVSDYYNKRTEGKSKDRWTEHCGRLLMDKKRDEVGYYFRKIGLLKR